MNQVVGQIVFCLLFKSDGKHSTFAYHYQMKRSLGATAKLLSYDLEVTNSSLENSLL